jgi:hypothetical protein
VGRSRILEPGEQIRGNKRKDGGKNERRGEERREIHFKKLANIIQDTAKSKTYNAGWSVGDTRDGSC